MIYKLLLFLWEYQVFAVKVLICFVDLNREIIVNGFSSVVLYTDF